MCGDWGNWAARLASHGHPPYPRQQATEERAGAIVAQDLAHCGECALGGAVANHLVGLDYVEWGRKRRRSRARNRSTEGCLRRRRLSVFPRSGDHTPQRFVDWELDEGEGELACGGCCEADREGAPTSRGVQLERRLTR